MLLALTLGLSIKNVEAVVSNEPLAKPAMPVRALNGENGKKMMEERKEIREERREDIKDIRISAKKEMGMIKRDMKDASSTEMFKMMKEKRQEISRTMKREVFEKRKSALIKELNVSLENLTNLRERINNRINTIEATTTNSTRIAEAKTALVIADEKLAKAKSAVAIFSTPTASSTEEVDLKKPREVGDAAIKSVKEARDSLKKVNEILKPKEMREDKIKK